MDLSIINNFKKFWFDNRIEDTDAAFVSGIEFTILMKEIDKLVEENKNLLKENQNLKQKRIKK